MTRKLKQVILTVAMLTAALVLIVILYNRNAPRTIEPPVITPASGTYYRERKIVMTKPERDQNTTIFFTTDGTDPKISNTVQVYINPFIITEDTTIKAYARSNHNVNASDVTERTYVIYLKGRESVQGGEDLSVGEDMNGMIYENMPEER